MANDKDATVLHAVAVKKCLTTINQMMYTSYNNMADRKMHYECAEVAARIYEHLTAHELEVEYETD